MWTPDFIIDKALFVQQEINPSGMYEVKLYDPMIQTTSAVRISDKIPVEPYKVSFERLTVSARFRHCFGTKHVQCNLQKHSRAPVPPPLNPARLPTTVTYPPN